MSAYLQALEMKENWYQLCQDRKQWVKKEWMRWQLAGKRTLMLPIA